jgi:hypothetical protein
MFRFLKEIKDTRTDLMCLLRLLIAKGVITRDEYVMGTPEPKEQEK